MTFSASVPDFEPRLRLFAAVIVRVGLNLQRGQRLLVTEPYELQGVARSAENIVAAVRAAADTEVEVIWGDGARLREFAEKNDSRGFARLAAANAAAMGRSLRNGDAQLFLQGSQPALMAGIPAERVAEQRRIGAEYFGPLAHQLVQGATNWTAAPAPSPGWAQTAYAELPGEQRLAALWETVFASCRVPRWSAASGRADEDPTDGRVPPPDRPLEAWQTHLATLSRRRDDLNARQLTNLRYEGAGTDLTLALPPEHIWCTAQLKTKSGVSFVANLPTEEVFTAPDKNSAEGTVRLGRPINYGGGAIDGIELKFRRGRVVEAQARTGTGAELLGRLLDTDDGAGRLGEVAIVGAAPGNESRNLPAPPAPGAVAQVAPAPWQEPGRLFHHPLLDENAASHIALGEAYGFCLRAGNSAALNRSLLHVDLPLDADVHFFP